MSTWFDGKRILSRIAVWMTAAAILLLAGCQGKAEGNGLSAGEEDAPAPVQNVESEMVYEGEVTELSEDITFRLVQFSGDKLYSGSVSYDEETDLCSCRVTRISAEGKAEEALTLPCGEGALSARYCVRDDGSICVSTAKDGTPWRLFLFDGTGELLVETQLNVLGESLGDGETVIPVQSDDQGRVFLLADGRIYLFDESGSYQGEIVLEDGAAGWMLARGGDGKVYTAYLSGKKQILARLDYEKKRAVDVGQGFPDCSNNKEGKIFACFGTGFWCVTDTELILYDWESGRKIKVFQWVNQGMLGTDVKGVTGGEDAPVIFTGGTGQKPARMYRLSPLSDEEMAYLRENGPDVIRVAGMWIPRDIEEAAIDFNASQKRYRVELVPYLDEASTDQEEFEIAREKLQRDAVLDTSDVDILCMQNLDADALTRQGALEDLTPYLEGSTLISRDDMFEPVLQAFMVDGRLVCIPKRFCMICISGDVSQLGDRTGWTLDEFLDFAEKHRGERLFGDTMFYPLCDALVNGDMFLEERDKKTVFDGEQCKRFLEVLNTLQDVSTDSEEEQYAIWQAAPLHLSYLQDFDVGVSRDPSIEFIGLPTADGTGGVRFEVGGTSQLCTILSQSDCREGAWAFYEYYLNREDSGGGFPIFRPLFDEMAEEWMNPVYTGHTMTAEGEVDAGSGFPLPEAGARRRWKTGDWYPYQGTQEDVDAVLDMIGTGGYWISRNEKVLEQILTEEGEAYFQGQKDLDTVADIIGNRWMLYKAENG